MTPDLQRSLAHLVQHPRSAFTTALRRRIVARGRELGFAPPSSSPFVWLLRLSSVAFGLAIVVSGAYAYESPAVNRTSPLFVVKRIGESLEIALARDQERLVDVYLRIAARRLAESEHLATYGVVDPPTIAEVEASTEQAFAVAKSLPEPSVRSTARERVAAASRQTARDLRSVSITAQVAANKPVIVVASDLVAMAPVPSTLPPTDGRIAPASDAVVSASPPRSGAVAGSAEIAPSPVSTIPAVPTPPDDPTLAAIESAIASSSTIAAGPDAPPATTLDPVKPEEIPPSDLPPPPSSILTGEPPASIPPSDAPTLVPSVTITPVSPLSVSAPPSSIATLPVSDVVASPLSQTNEGTPPVSEGPER